MLHNKDKKNRCFFLLVLANLEVRLFNKWHWLENKQSAKAVVRRGSLNAWILTPKIFYCCVYNFADSVHQLIVNDDFERWILQLYRVCAAINSQTAFKASMATSLGLDGFGSFPALMQFQRWAATFCKTSLVAKGHGRALTTIASLPISSSFPTSCEMTPVVLPQLLKSE